MPIATPVWFVVHQGAVYFGTPSRSRKAERLNHDARISFLVEGGERWAELWAVHLTGHAALVDDKAELDAIAALQAAKYDGFATPREQYPEATRRFYDRDPVRAVYRIAADERILSWDNAKLGLA
jgi:hypothetical protein